MLDTRLEANKGAVHSRKRRRVATRPEREVLEKRYRTHSVPRVARSVRRLVAGCAAGCGVGNQTVLLSKCQSCTAESECAFSLPPSRRS